MNRLGKFTGIVMVTSVAMVACSAAPAAGKPGTVTAVKVDSVTLDSAASYWTNAQKIDVLTKATEEGKPDGPVVSIQAAYDASSVAFRLEWADTTGNLTRADWKYDGTKFTRDTVQDDRMMMMWPIGNDAKFSTKGCGAVCHTEGQDPEKWYMASDSADLKYDYISWTSARSNTLGQAEDKWLGMINEKKDIESAMFPDKESKATSSANNQNKAKDAPAFMNGKDMTSKYIMTGDEVPIDLTKLKAGDTVPGYILKPYVDSRGDVSVKGTWANGKWVVVVKRALNTGHDDDAQFSPPKAVPFGVAVTDHTDLHHHTVTPDVLTLQWQ